jgi:ATP-dependent Clp protease ATP-binding subunit ClpB
VDDKLTRKSQDALSATVRRAAADGNPQVDPLHLLVALIAQNGGTTAPLLRAVGADPAVVAKEAEARLGRLPRASGQTLSAPETSRPLLALINTASARAREMNDEYVSTEHAWWVPPRWMSMGSASRRTRRWSAGSRRCSWASPPWRTRSRSCAA